MSALQLDQVEGGDVLPARVDVVVIGGGIIGTSTAYFLSERGVSVALCEKGQVGAEQSGRNWGWVRQMARLPEELPLSMVSAGIWRRLDAKLEAETGYRQSGILYVCASPREVADHEDWLRHARACGLESRLLTRKEVAALVPGLAQEFRAGLYTASDGRAEPAKASAAVARGARKNGAVILTHCAVRGVETAAGAISGVVTERGPIACNSVVLAGGAWSRLFIGNHGIDFPQLKVLGAAARIDRVEGAPNFVVGGSNFAVRQRLDGGFTIGMRNATLAPITPDSFRLFADFVPTLVKQWHELKLRVGSRFLEEWRTPRRWRLDEASPFERVRILDPVPSEGINRKALSHLVKALPAFAAARITHHWSGLIDVTPDAVPVIGPVAEIPGLFLASGFSGHGFGIGPGAGRLMADLVTGARPCVDPTPFRFGRFRRSRESAARLAAAQAA